MRCVAASVENIQQNIDGQIAGAFLDGYTVASADRDAVIESAIEVTANRLRDYACHASVIDDVSERVRALKSVPPGPKGREG